MAGSPGTPASDYGSTTPYKPSGQSAPNNPYTSPSQRPNPYQTPTQAGYYGPQPKTREQVKGRVVPPAIALMVVSGLSGLMAMGMIFVGIMAVADNGNADEGDAFAFAFFAA